MKKKSKIKLNNKKILMKKQLRKWKRCHLIPMIIILKKIREYWKKNKISNQISQLRIITNNQTKVKNDKLELILRRFQMLTKLKFKEGHLEAFVMQSHLVFFATRNLDLIDALN